MKTFKLVCFNNAVYDGYSDALQSGAAYELHHETNNLESAKTLAVVKAAYRAAYCLDGDNGLVVFAVDQKGTNKGGHIFPQDVGLKI